MTELSQLRLVSPWLLDALPQQSLSKVVVQPVWPSSCPSSALRDSLNVGQARSLAVGGRQTLQQVIRVWHLSSVTPDQCSLACDRRIRVSGGSTREVRSPGGRTPE